MKAHPRKVYIARQRNAFFVMFLERTKGQRLAAAQFYAQDHSEQDVRDWVNAKNTLKLVPNPSA